MEERTENEKGNAQDIRSAAEQTADPRVDLAVQRTELALDRTQLAWVRTAFTFITAGIAIDKAAAALHEARVLAGTNWVTGSHVVGITLTAASTLFLLIATSCISDRLALWLGSKAPNRPGSRSRCSSHCS